MIEMDVPKFMLKNKLRFELYDDIRGERINNMIR